jgi:hypothetical protein
MSAGDLSDIVKHPLFVASVSLTAGTLLASIIYRLRNRMVRIHYFTLVNRIGISQNDPVFGSIGVNWNQNALRNLHIVTISLENVSTADLADLHLKAYVDDATTLLSERSGIADTSFILPWSDSFKQSITVAPGGTPTSVQQYIYYHNRD